MNIEKEFNSLKKNVALAKGNIARTVGIGLVALAPMVAMEAKSASAQQQPPVTSSENPFIPEVGGEYQIIIDESVFNNPKADELRRLLRLGYFRIGDCAKIQEIISTKSIEDPNSTLNGGSEPVEYRHVFSRCDAPARPTAIPVAPIYAPVAVSQPEQLRSIEACSVGDMQIVDLRGKGITSISGVPSWHTGNFDLADHGIFRSVSGLEALRNVLGEPGAFLADWNNIPDADKASWDAKVNAGLAEYIRTSGPNINFYDLQTNSDRGVSWNAEKGVYEFRLVLPKHVIVRIDAEEMKMSLSSASGDRNIRFNMCQSGANRGVDFGQQTLFTRTPYEQESVLILESPTIPGTQVQILGMQVQSPTAFASAEAFMQGVGVRQARADYPRYLVYAVNANDLTVGAAESPAPGAAFQRIANNY